MNRNAMGYATSLTEAGRIVPSRRRDWKLLALAFLSYGAIIGGLGLMLWAMTWGVTR